MALDPPVCGPCAHRRVGQPPDRAQCQAVCRVLRRLLHQDRVWSTRTLAAALAVRGLEMQPRTVRKYLGLMGACYCRTHAPGSFTWTNPASPPPAPGVAPTSPTKIPQGRRVHVMAALVAPDPRPRCP